MSRMWIRPGELTSGCRTRLIACANAFARTGCPSLKRKPRRNVKVYVLRSSETFTADATSGTGRNAAGAGLSG